MAKYLLPYKKYEIKGALFLERIIQSKEELWWNLIVSVVYSWMAKHFKMLNSQQNNGTKVSHKYVHTRNITPFTQKVSWNSVGRFTRIALQNKKAVGLTDWQTDQIHYTPANPCVVYNNLILPYIIHINNH